ncbi:hypothetical protein [Actinomadura rupiterrae]|uniref:hypothetical protein n=1 Tax=Actinomadura rupiterrae TaxID=559627 RepID=UPI0020A2DA82|nr:hypothetical protein [Actinomadura rupiterrae]MCP2336647.1 ABC-type Na+ efflux pump permease subunit [Actinomadura rupiterrae]
MRGTRTATVLLAAALLIGGVSGCSGLGGKSDGHTSGVRAANSVGLGKPSVETAGKVVVKGTFDSPLAAGAKVDIAINSLHVDGRLATLIAQFTPHVPNPSSSLSLFSLNGHNGIDPALIDPVNLKRYVVVKDSGGHELQTSEIFATLANEQPTQVFFTFAAPPENVKSVNVQLGTWPTFRAIPVER